MSIPHPQRQSLLIVTTRIRDHGRLDFPWLNGVDANFDAIRDALTRCDPNEPVVFGGGEPTLRADFLDLLDLLPENGILATDGLALHQSKVVQKLVDSGLSTVQISLHSARADAHDWLVGIPGAHRRASTAISTLVQHGVDVHVTCTLTRPMTPYLEETVAFLYRLGVRTINFRMLERQGMATDAYITLAPRFGLMEPSLEAAMRVALRHGMKATMTGIPHCGAPQFANFHAPQPNTIIPADIPPPEAMAQVRTWCGVCGEPCLGPPDAYTELFGWTEFSAKRGALPADNHVPSKPQSGVDVPAPPPRAHRTPATRVRDAITQSQRYDLDGDPIIGEPVRQPPSVVSVRFPTEESTRAIKKRLVYASQQGAQVLQIVGDTHHTQSIELFRECQRLSFSAVVFSGDLQGLQDCDARALFSLRGLRLILYPPTQENALIARRIEETASVPVGPYLTLAGSELECDIEDRWAHRNWPGEPHFALAPNADIAALTHAIESLRPCPEKQAALRALKTGRSPLFGEPKSKAIEIPRGVTWPNLCSFAVHYESRSP